MGAPKNRSENRKARRDRNHSNHTPLLSLVESERRVRRPVKAAAREVKPLNDAQALYDAHIRASIITFGVGPAGTGKTWLAATRAAQALKAGEIERIIVTRPALEAGESLGFLPGEMDDKYQPYFRPVCDALAETLGSGPLEYHLKSGTIEARPLAYLRGATFKNCLVLFDEAQNATVSQMKLFLTRIGDHSRVVINGDPDQIDLPRASDSGLMDAVRRLGSVKGVGVVTFGRDDIVRSGICREIVEAYAAPLSERYIH